MIATHEARRLSALRAVPGFAGLPTDELAALAGVAEEQLVARGAPIVKRGDPPLRAYVILDGKAHARGHALGPRSVVGGLELLAGVPIACDVTTESDVLALALRRGDVLDFFEESYAATFAGMRALAAQVLGELARRDMGHRPFAAPPPPPRRRSSGPLSLADRILHLHNGMMMGKSRLEAVADVAQVTVEEHAPAGTVLWLCGDLAAHTYSIVSGEIECRRPGRAAYRVGPGNDAGAVEAHAGAARWYDAIAATDLVALRIELADVMDVIEDNVDLAHDILRSMAGVLLQLGRSS